MRIDIYFDLVCPWCYIGKRRFERALALRPPLAAVDLHWLPFQLNPGAPKQGLDRTAYLAAKFGGAERARRIYAVVAEAASRDGLRLAIDRIVRTPNTLDAHRLVRFAAAQGGDPATMIGAIFGAYFEDGADIGDSTVLASIAEGLGFSPQAVRDYLSSDADVAGVLADDMAARRSGIQAVPCFVFNRRYALSGAQEPYAFWPMFDLAETPEGTREESRETMALVGPSA